MEENDDEKSQEKLKNSLWKEAVLKKDLSSFRQLAWCNIGIKYNWTDREYNLKEITAPIPQRMSTFCEGVCGIVKAANKGKEKEKEEEWTLEMIPQTSIINYYAANAKRPMGAHRDAAEKINSPLVSCSLGCTAILLASRDENEIPCALYLRSGDVLVMSKESRWALHAVARVIPETCPQSLLDALEKNETCEKDELQLIEDYIKCNRLNFNVRQVVKV